VIAGRSQASERFVGLKGAPAPLAAMAKANEGSIETITKEGVPVFAAFSRSEISHWVISIGVPVAALSGGLNKLLIIGSACALVLLAIGLALAAYQSNRIARAVQDLIAPAMALGRGAAPIRRRLQITEANDVAKAINRAHRLLLDRTAERDNAKVKEAAAETAAGVMDEFVATVSHELRTPLTSIAASLGLLAGGTGGALPPPVLRLITIAHANTQRLVRLINDILDIGKIDSGKMVFHLAAIDLRVTATDAIEASRALAQEYGISMRLEAGPSCMVRADADRVTQVVANLLSNAIKFSPPSGEVTVTVGRHAGMGRIAVQDRGAGIPEEFKPRIFEKFTQADNSDTRQKGGTGLGLNIVQKIVSQHGGTVGFVSGPGAGTTFNVDMPLWSEAVKAA
jgi:signal transduction histidine kinase